jgi:hypothetical protein
MAQGEFAYYVQYIEKNTQEQEFTTSNASDFFSLDPSYKTFMNPANLQTFFDNYDDQNYGAISKRFTISDYA